MRKMKATAVFLAAIHALLAVPAAFGNSDHDLCLQEEKRLRSEQADLCSSMGYLFNPSACINARKALIRHENGKCRQAVAGEMDEQGKAVIKPPAESPLHGDGDTSTTAVIAAAVQAKESSVSAEMDSMRRDIEEMKAELRLLRQEIERLQGKK